MKEETIISFITAMLKLLENFPKTRMAFEKELEEMGVVKFEEVK